MPRHTASCCDCDDSTQPARRSVRIQQQRKAAVQRSANSTQSGRASDNSSTSSQGAAKRKRKRNAQGEEDCDSQAAMKRSSRSDDITPFHEDKAVKPIKRAVRFDDDEPLEALSDDGAAEEAAAKAAALSVSAEFLASRPENAQYASLNPRAMPCPPDSVARIEPSRTLDSKGRVLLQYPIRFVLAYRIEVGALYRYLKSVKRDFIDFQGTLLAFQLKIDEGLNMRHEHGLSEVVYMGRRTWTMIMSQSDRPETLPYPTLRIRKFQAIMGCTSQPRVYPYQPRTYRLKPGVE